MPVISIVVPVYNAGKKLNQCIRSILSQSFTDFELILVDDGSKDQSRQVCDQFAANDSRVRVLHQANQGCIAARKNGVNLVEGQYCCFVDADDVIPPTALDTMLRASTEFGGNTIIVGNINRFWRRFDLNKGATTPCYQISKPAVYDHKRFIEELYCGWFGISNLSVSLCAKLFPTKLLQETMATVPKVVHFLGEDLVMTLDCMPKAEKIVVLPDIVYSQRPGGGTSRFQPKMMDDCISLYNHKKVYAQRYPMPQDVELLMDIELCNMAISYFRQCAESSNLPDDQVLVLIRSVRGLPEVTNAASNNRIDTQRFTAARMLRTASDEEILASVKPTWKRRIRKVLVRTLMRFA